MPDGQSLSWQSTREELNVCRKSEGGIDFDKYRKEKLEAVERHTGVPLVVYATDFLSADKVRACEGQVGIDGEDPQGFNEVTKDLPNGPLDVVLHSPGGSPEAAEAIVQLLRDRFNPIRFFIPVAAKSAGTMVALSGNEILMPPSAELGPIDPQFPINDGAGGLVMTPAQTLIDQFAMAQQQCAMDPRMAIAWAPILSRFAPGLLQQCHNSIRLSKDLVKGWMKSYMLDGKPDADNTAEGVVNYLADHNAFYSHGRRVSIADLHRRGVNIRDIRSADAVLWQHIEAAWYSVLHTFQGTGVFKLFENSRGRGYMRVVQSVVAIAPAGMGGARKTQAGPLSASGGASW